MPGIALLLLLTLPARLDQTDDEIDRVVRHWIQVAQQHRPGTIDGPLLEIAAEPPAHFDVVRRHLRSLLKVDLRTVDARNDVLRRGTLLHTDIALLLPQQAATFTLADLPSALDPSSARPWVIHETNTLVFAADGEYMATAEDSAHWWIARLLLTWILPHPSADPFVALWYRAIAARFEGANLFGSAMYHLHHALEVLPRDPVLLFYAGAMYEAYASPSIQSIPISRPALARRLKVPSPQEEWRIAERLLRESLEAKGPVEARVRLGRVLGRLGKHEEAVAVLGLAMPQLRERRLKYVAELFLGSEEAALNHVERARQSFDRAAQLFPTAQSPLLALSELFHHTGNRAEGLKMLRRIAALPADPREREDPWRDYLTSFAADADELLANVRAWVDRKERQ